jgi:hypothetical protein
MPGGDRTGPRGEGSRTGRGAGFCSGYDSPGYMNPAAGYGRGIRFGMGGMMGGRMGGGRGRGYRHIYYATGLPRWARGGGYPAPANAPAYAAEDIGSLRQEADFLEQRLKSIIDRIKELESDSGKDDS